MKKIVGTIAAIALATSAAFAEVNVGMGFNRGFFTPFAYDGNAKADISTSWGAQPRIGVSFSAASEQVGVVADVKFDGGSVAVNDNAYIWVKPVSWFKMNIGQSFDDTLRGNACFGLWDWLRPGNIIGEDVTFVRVCQNPLSGAYAPLEGAILMLDPVEGLHISVGLPITGYAAQTWENVGSHIQVAAGYTIADILQIKAQWIGNGTSADNQVQGVINAAVSLKAVENMTLDAGVFFNTAKNSNIDIGLFWSMPISVVTLSVNGKLSLATVDTAATTVNAGAALAFDVGNGFGAGVDVRYSQSFQKNVNTDPAIAFGAWLDKGIANGTLGVGVECGMKTAIRDFAAADFSVAVPVRVQCFF
jgi:hypothetical protein